MWKNGELIHRNLWKRRKQRLENVDKSEEN